MRPNISSIRGLCLTAAVILMSGLSFAEDAADVRPLKINLGPSHARDFRSPLARQQEQFSHRPERITSALESLPHHLDLGVLEYPLTRYFLDGRFHAGERRGGRRQPGGR